MKIIEPRNLPILATLMKYLWYYNPKALDNLRETIKHKNLSFNDNPFDAAKESNALIIATEWKEFFNI